MQTLHVLAAFVADVATPALPARVRDHCGTLVADSVACTVGAIETREGQALAQALLPSSAEPSGIRAGGTGPLSYQIYRSGDLLAGVYIDASLANMLDFDDVYEGSGHIGCVVVPSVFRVGGLQRSSGQEVIAALAAGFEVGCRFAEALRPSDAARAQVWGIGTRVAPAAAAAAARLLGLSADATAHAIALACATAPIPSVRKTVYGSSGVTWVKNNMGIAAAAGVSSAYLARAGALGPLDILDGDQGFHRMIGTDTWKPDELTDDLEERWQLDRLGLKAYPCCRHAHAVIDAAGAGLARLALRPDDIDELVVAGPVWLGGPPFTVAAPVTMLDAQYSLPFCLAAALLDLEPGPAWFDGSTYHRPDLRALAAKVRIDAQPSAAGRVRISGAGRSTVVQVDAPRGSPSSPLAPEERWAKFMRLTGRRLGLETAERVYERLRNLGSAETIHDVVLEIPAADLSGTTAPVPSAAPRRSG